MKNAILIAFSAATLLSATCGIRQNEKQAIIQAQQAKDKIILLSTMTKEQAFFIDLVNAIPENTHWSFQCHADDFYATLRGISLVTEPATIGIAFKDAFRSQISGLIIDDVFERINFLEVSQDGQKLLEVFDGFLIVTLSKTFPLAGTALSQYLDQDLLFVSEIW